MTVAAPTRKLQCALSNCSPLCHMGRELPTNDIGVPETNKEPGCLPLTALCYGRGPSWMLQCGHAWPMVQSGYLVRNPKKKKVQLAAHSIINSAFWRSSHEPLSLSRISSDWQALFGTSFSAWPDEALFPATCILTCSINLFGQMC